jgi:hypothetical protein
MRSILAVCALISIPLQAHASIIYTAQIRQVTAAAGPSGGFGVSDSDAAPDFLPWLGSASIVYANISGSSSSSVGQESVLGATSITNVGTLSAAADTSFVASATNSFSTSFTLAAATPYVSSLSGLTPTLFALQLTPGGTPFGANSSGILPAGSYTLTMQFQRSAGPLQSSSAGAYQYTLTVPEPGSLLLGIVGGAGLGVLVLRRRGRPVLGGQ